MKQLLFIIAAALLAAGTCNRINARNMEKPKKISVFPVGDKLPETFSKYFVGQAYLARLTRNGALNCPISNVTFEPGCRNNWHSHTGGQILVAVGGRGYYQAEGEPARELLPGDVVEIAPDAAHWHGAAPDSWFSHLAIETNPQINRNTWLGPVDDAHYSAATADCRDRLHTRLCDRARCRDCCDCRIFGRGRFRSNVHVFRSAHSCGNVHVRNSAPVLGQERGSAPARRGRRDPCAAVFRVRIGTCGDRSRINRNF